ncbi:MAG: hypothetical protein AB7W16_03405 [Candidatus Obscuribacterales bacterium]
MLVNTTLLLVALLSFAASAEARAKTSRKRPARVTVGSVEIRDWQSSIVENYPNLKHYHWNPIYSNVQGIRMVSPPGPPRQKARQSRNPVVKNQVARKSRHPQSKHVVYRPAAGQRHIYKKPVHLDLNPALRLPPVARGDMSGELSARDTRAALRLPEKKTPNTSTDARLRGQEALVAARLDSPMDNRFENKKVQAELMIYEHEYQSSLKRPVTESTTLVKSRVQARVTP